VIIIIIVINFIKIVRFVGRACGNIIQFRDAPDITAPIVKVIVGWLIEGEKSKILFIDILDVDFKDDNINNRSE
jgi:uncharacterized protein (DUF983 family)